MKLNQISTLRQRVYNSFEGFFGIDDCNSRGKLGNVLFTPDFPFLLWSKLWLSLVSSWIFPLSVPWSIVFMVEWLGRQNTTMSWCMMQMLSTTWSILERTLLYRVFEVHVFISVLGLNSIRSYGVWAQLQ